MQILDFDQPVSYTESMRKTTEGKDAVSLMHALQLRRQGGILVGVLNFALDLIEA